MKKIIALLLVATMIISLVGCSGGGGSVKLEEGQSHFTFNEDGELTLVGYLSGDDLEDDFDIDFDDDADDIKDDMQDFMDEGIEEASSFLDIEWEVAIQEVKKDGDFATITVVFSDFEFMYMGMWYEKLEDLMDDDYNDTPDFVTFAKGDEVDEDDLDDYEDNFTIYIDGGEEGAYYEFPGKIQLVDEDIKFEKTSDTIIFVEDGEEGFITVDAEIDGEIIDFMDMMGDFDFDDLDLDDLDLDDIDLSDFDLDNIDLDDIDLDDFDMSDISSGGEAEPGNPNDLSVGQSHITYHSDGRYEMSANMESSDFEWLYEGDFNDSEAEMRDAIVEYYDLWYSANVEVMNLAKHSNSVEFTFIGEDVMYLDYTYNYTLQDQADWYGGFDGLFDTYNFMNFNDRSPLMSSDELAQYANNHAIFAGTDFSGNGTYYTFPGDILVVDGYMTWAKVSNNTIFVDDWSYGIIIFED